jgi:rRNA-processing protein FCF1
VKRVKRRKKQKNKGMITDLLKRGAKQALRAAAQTGLYVLDKTTSLKDAIKTNGIRVIKFTAQPLLA